MSSTPLSRSAVFSGILIGLMATLGSYLQFAQQDSPARVESFTPQGVVKKVRQVQVRFSEAMVPLGDPKFDLLPFEIKSPEKGSARWADSRNWEFDFDRDLPAGVRCEFRLKPGLRSLAGHPVGGTEVYSFSTGGPAILNSTPHEGEENIAEDQIFILELDGQPDNSSVNDNVYFQVEGLQERVGFRILGDAEQQRILKSFRYRRDWPKNLLLIQAKQQFPVNRRVNLVWGKGVATASGVTNQQDQVLPFRSRSPFTATFECERVNAQSPCIPITPLRLIFSAPIRPQDARKILLKDPQGRQWIAQVPRYDEENENFTQQVFFKGPFPEKGTFKISLPADLKDDSGRKLSNASKFPLEVQTDDYPPLVKFAANFGILELEANPLLPVTVRNVEAEVSGQWLKEGMAEETPPEGEKAVALVGPTGLEGKISGQMFRVPLNQPGAIEEWMLKLNRRGWDDRHLSIFADMPGVKTRPFKLPKLQGAKSFEVIGVPLPGPGFYLVEMESQILGNALLGKPVPMYVPTSVLVTNMAVHFKRGLESSLVWVTTLDKGEPVAGAGVEIRGKNGESWFKGTTDRDGIVRISSLPCALDDCNLNYSSKDPYYVFARKENDISFVQSTWSEGIESWRFNLPEEYDPSFLLAHTVLDRSLFRAGETVHMKHFLRTHGAQGFKPARAADVPPTLRISHLGSDQKYEQPLQWDSLGIAESSWQIPRDAKLGMYSIQIKRQGKDQSWMGCGSFRVEEYRVPLMKAEIKFPAEIQVNPKELSADLTARYLSGGMAAALPVKFRHQLQPAYAGGFEGFEEFTFGNGRLVPGILKDREYEEEEAPPEKRTIKTIDLTLDSNGSARTTVSSIPRAETPQSILGELEFRDPNGEVQTVSARAQLWPSRWLVGVKPEDWVSSPKSVKFQAAVVDTGGKAVNNAPVRVELLQRKYYSSRKRLAGGFYAFEHHTEVKLIKSLCEGRTDSHGLLPCEAVSPLSGEMILQATVRDSGGLESGAYRDVWVAGDDRWWFKAEDSDRIDILPEKKRYEPGETARFQVRMPFAEATALVTVEREGIVDSFVKKLSGKNPVIELPLKPNYSPNVYVSALVVRGRAGDVQPTATVDLGRPAFKLGIGQIFVGWRDHELKVKVSSDRPVYKVREKAQVTISVSTPEGKPAAGGEVAFAAVDEGLLELMPNSSWQLLEAMMRPRGYGLRTITAQMQVIGKRHFGLKALPSGGGGGQQTTRELFDTLLLWKGRVPLSPEGTATVEVPLNDSLTSFKLVAIASAGLGRFGTGATSIRSTQDLAIYSGLSPLAREGDRFPAQFTLRNSTDRPLTVQATLKVQGLAGAFPARSLSIAPGQAQAVSWDITVPASAEKLRYQIEVREKEKLLDRLAATQQILPAVPVRTLQATLAQVEKELQFDIQRPDRSLPGAGGVQVTLRPTLVNGLEAVRAYMERYRYDCLEQQISKAVALRDARQWESIMKKLPTYLSSDGLAKYFPTMSRGSVCLTSYLLSIAHEAGYAIPPDPLEKMSRALENFVTGRLVEYTTLKTADLSIRKLMALEALSRYGQIKPELFSSITLEPNLWPTSAVLDWFNLLKRVPAIPAREPHWKEAEQILRSRLNFQGTIMGFSTDRTDSWWWLMLSPDGNMNRLILSLLEVGIWKEDIPRILRGTLDRQVRGIWNTTPANAWGVLAVEKFAKAFEPAPPAGIHSVTLNNKTQTQDWGKKPKGQTLSFPWPPQQSKLTITASPQGKPWSTVESRAAIPLDSPLSTGYKIEKTFAPLETKSGGLKNGDLVRIHLKIEAQSDMGWVVVSDPIPAGSSILGTGLGRDSQLATQGERNEGWVWPTFEERSQEAFRAFYEYVPKGNWTVEYTLRLNQAGKFHLPPTRVEALYAPEMFGEIPNSDWEIK